MGDINQTQQMWTLSALHFLRGASAISTASGHAGRQHPVLEASAVAEGAGLRASIRIMRGVVAGGALSQTSAVSIPKVADESDEAFEAAFRASFRITAP